MRLLELIKKQIYQVSMMGFLPGLPFLTELDSKLKMPRRSNPRNLVPSGSVGIAINPVSYTHLTLPTKA